MTNTIVYVDNDNISFARYETIITSLLKNTTLTCKIFIKGHDLFKIEDDRLLLHYEFFLCKSPIKSKNGSDISLVIECMKDLLSNKSIDKYIIVSNDTGDAYHPLTFIDDTTPDGSVEGLKANANITVNPADASLTLAQITASNDISASGNLYFDYKNNKRVRF